MTNPILLDFPHSFDSERLTIRCPMPGDGEEVCQAIIDSQPELIPWMPWAVGEQTVEGTEANVRDAYAKFLQREDLRLSLYLKGTTTLVGSSGLHRIDWNIPKFEIGYWARTKFAGNGYITEATAAITAFAFEQLGAKRIEIRCDENNVRSAVIPPKVGYTLEGTLINEARHHISGELRNTMIFAQTVP